MIYRDVAANPPPPVNEDWIVGAYAPPTAHSAAATAAIARSDELVGELLSVDRIVVSSPIHNFLVPSTLKAYIDQIVRIGRTPY